MTTRQQIHGLLKTVNARIDWIKTGKKNIFTQQSLDLVDTLTDKLSRLNGVTRGNIRIGALQSEDEQLFLNALENFLDNPLTTLKGQKVEILDKGYESFTRDHFNVSRETYDNLVKVWESDTFQKFKENFGTYANVIDEMAKNPKSYKKAISMLAGVNRSNKEHGRYATNGELDVKAFIDRWREL